MSMEHNPSPHPASHYQPEPIEIGPDECARAEDQQVLFTNSILGGTVMLSYDPGTRIGLIEHFSNAVEQEHDVKNFLLSSEHFSLEPARVVLWAADLEVVNPEEAPLIMLDCTDGTISIDNEPVEL